MLPAAQAAILLRVNAALTKHGETELASEVNGWLTADAEQRATVSAARKASAGTRRGRTPSTSYRVEVDTLGIETELLGVPETHKFLKEVLTQLGCASRLPRRASLASTLSKNGQWHMLVETENGTASILARKLQ